MVYLVILESFLKTSLQPKWYIIFKPFYDEFGLFQKSDPLVSDQAKISKILRKIYCPAIVNEQVL